MFWEKEGKFIYSYDGETVCIEAWGKAAQPRPPRW